MKLFKKLGSMLGFGERKKEAVIHPPPEEQSPPHPLGETLAFPADRIIEENRFFLKRAVKIGHLMGYGKEGDRREDDEQIINIASLQEIERIRGRIKTVRKLCDTVETDVVAGIINTIKKHVLSESTRLMNSVNTFLTQMYFENGIPAPDSIPHIVNTATRKVLLKSVPTEGEGENLELGLQEFIEEIREKLFQLERAIAISESIITDAENRNGDQEPPEDFLQGDDECEPERKAHIS